MSEVEPFSILSIQTDLEIRSLYKMVSVALFVEGRSWSFKLMCAFKKARCIKDQGENGLSVHWIVCQGVTSFCVKIEDSQSRLNLWLHKAKTWNILRKLVLFWGIYEKSFSLKYINRKGTWDFTASCVDKIIMGETSERVLIPLQLDELVLFSLNMLIVLHPMAFLHPLTQQRVTWFQAGRKCSVHFE